MAKSFIEKSAIWADFLRKTHSPHSREGGDEEGAGEDGGHQVEEQAKGEGDKVVHNTGKSGIMACHC